MFGLLSFYIGPKKHTLLPCHEAPQLFTKYSLEKTTAMYKLAGRFGTVFCQQLSTGNVGIQYVVCRPKEDCILHLKNKSKWIGAHLVLGHSISYYFKGLGNIDFRSLQFNIFHFPTIDIQVPLQKDKEYILLDIYFKPAYLKRGMLALPATKNLTKAIFRKVSFYEQSMNLSFYVQSIIKALLHPLYIGKLQHDFLQIKSMELLLCLLNTNSPNKALVNLERFADKLHQAKNFIAAHYDEHYSIKKMAKLSMMNSTHFKIGFHQQFGMGPFEFLIQVRMQQSIELLKNNQLSINQIADKVGYQNPSSFINAFKKHFGSTPGQMRKNNIS